jgi:hypothetical protein
MFNILIDTFKQDIIREYHKRRLIVWLCAVCVVQLSFLIFLVPLYVHMQLKEKNLAASQTHVATTQNANGQSTNTALIQNTQATLSILAAHLPQGSVNATLAHLVSLKGSSITFREIAITDQTASTSEVTLQGVSTTREALLAFSQSLQADNAFSNVVLPVSDFAKDSNISFSLTLNVNLEKI